MLVSRYRPMLYLQYFLLLEDLGLNSFTNLGKSEVVVLLVLHVIQDVCILFAVIVLFLLFFNTYIFQAGLISILINKFKWPIIIALAYLTLSIALHVWEMTMLWNQPTAFIYAPGFTALYVFQRLCAVLYYYSYKRTALRLSDPCFYDDSEWIQREFVKRH